MGIIIQAKTDDMRDAASIVVVNEPQKEVLNSAYDPKAIHEAKVHYLKDNNSIYYAESKYEALKNTDALILLTEWKEFRSPDFEELKRLLNNRIIFDGRNQYNAFNLEEKGWEYYQIGK